MIIENPTEEEFDKAIASGKVLVDFWAAWCGPCRSQSPIVENIAETTDITVIKIDVDGDDTLPAKFGVKSIPTLLLYKNGEQIKKFIGFTPAGEIKAEFDRA